MSKKHAEKTQKRSGGDSDQNQNHNSKKESLGPNTKR